MEIGAKKNWFLQESLLFINHKHWPADVEIIADVCIISKLNRMQFICSIFWSIDRLLFRYTQVSFGRIFYLFPLNFSEYHYTLSWLCHWLVVTSATISTIHRFTIGLGTIKSNRNIMDRFLFFNWCRAW